MILQVEVQGIFETNSYFYVDNKTSHGFLIDPGAEADKLLRIISENNFTIEKILLTHGHFDHIGAVEELREKLKIPVCMQKNGKDYAENPVWNLSAYFGLNMTLKNVTYLEDYDEIFLTANKDFKLKMIPLPGHTTDGAIFYDEKNSVAFVGDSIFRGSIGRTDFPGGNSRQLYYNIIEKIFTLPPETIMLSGHTEQTTVEAEKSDFLFNPD